ncbi:MAG: superoxide dismutase [Sedimentisphaerales bacterium]|jgi:Fe-Mn family superoxide dismutase
MFSKMFGGFTRREFLNTATGAAVGLTVAGLPQASNAVTEHILPPLPYNANALEPIISSRTIGFHYGKHHKAYVDNLNKLVAGTDMAAMPLREIILATYDKTDKVKTYHNAAQAWNHEFYWQCLKPRGGGKPPAALKRKMEASFGSVEACTSELAAVAGSQFGSGWAWLVLDGNKLKTVKTGNADNPMTQGMKPLLTIDVWEHAYYLDHQNRRAEYVKGVIDRLMNWDFAAENFAKS